MVKVTLRTMLATIQNRQPLPAQPLPPPPNTIMPDSSPGRLCSSRPLVLLTDLRSLLLQWHRVHTRGDETQKANASLREFSRALANSPDPRDDG
jgi:hypothetical protein